MHDLPAASPVVDTDALVALAADMGHDPDHVRGLLETRRFAGDHSDTAPADERPAVTVRIVIVHRRDALTLTVAGDVLGGGVQWSRLNRAAAAEWCLSSTR